MALLGLTPPEITPPADLAQVKEPEHKAARAESAAAPVVAKPDHGADAPARTTPPTRPEAQTKSPPAAARKAEPPRVDPGAPVTVAIHDDASNVRLDFRFAAPTPAAAFRRGKTLWLVFDTSVPIVTTALANAPGVRNVIVNRNDDGAAVVRIEFVRPKPMNFFAEAANWSLLVGDNVADSAKPLTLSRTGAGEGHSSMTIPFPGARHMHRIKDPSSGEMLLVVTALGPARGLPKGQDFVELRALASMQGVVVQPLADDVSVDVSKDKITIARPGGLLLSSAALSSRDSVNSAALQPELFDAQTWGFDRHANYEERQFDLIARAAAAPDYKRRSARLDLARFYLARGMFAEAKGVLDVVTQDERNGDGPTGSILKSVTEVMLGRSHEALKDLSAPDIGDAGVAQIWRAMAYAGQGQCDRADRMFKAAGAAIDALPVELRRRVKLEAMRCAIQVRDFGAASAILDDFETLGAATSPLLQLLTGRLQEGLGKDGEALASYRSAAASTDRPIAAQATLRELALRQKLGRIKRPELIASLEELTTVWRGDETEAEALKLLAHAYTEDKRYRDAFHVMRTALLAHPNSDLTQQIHDEAAETFEKLFLSGAGDAMPPIEALGLFYDYRDLTPLGRRGDDMIRRLADRLVSVDLLDQAAELLQHQVDYRLQGAARAQVAAKLATIYLMNRKPDLALAAIQKTRVSDLAGDVRDQRLLLEARAMSEIGRHELALEMIDGMKSAQAQRLRADILWAGKTWRRAAEAIEYLYGARWKEAKPLDAAERMDVLRMAIGYALADETLSLARIRERYGAPMKASVDRHAFEVVTAPIGPGTDEFRAVAATVTSLKTLDAFLEDMRKRYPDETPAAAAAPAKPPAPQKESAKPDKTPTGSIAARASR
jgi:tetratricopeptide (TPR) repeat protein